MKPTTAILLFSRSAAAEARVKGYGVRVAEALLSRTQRTLRRSGLPLYRSTEIDQGGGTFGEKLSRAVTEVFARGHREVIVVSSDCPRLTVGAIRRGTELLASGSNVVGPDGRGGAYLIGLRSEDFCASAFASLGWQTPNLASELADLVDSTLLGRRLDVNVLADLVSGWRYFKSLFQALACLAVSRAEPVGSELLVVRTVEYSAPVLRGPPRV